MSTELGTDRGTCTDRARDAAAALRVSDVVGRLVRMLRRGHVSPLGSSSMSALATVARQGSIRLGELAEREGVTPATLSRIVTVLEREGFVERRTDPADRRSAFLSATPWGLHAVQVLLGGRADILVTRMASLSAADHAALAAGLDVVERLIADDLDHEVGDTHGLHEPGERAEAVGVEELGAL